MVLVNTLIIGTQKGGTTSLFNYLQQHPEVCTSQIKETNFFLEERLFEKGTEEFHSFFPDCGDKKITLTSHAHLLPGIDVPKHVHSYNPFMKMIVILRDPSERAYSAYRHAVKHGWEQQNISFSEALDREWNSNGSFRDLYDLAYVRNGLYHLHLSNWMTVFDPSSLLILTTKELSEDIGSTLKKVFQFLELDEIKVDTANKFNEGGKARFKLIQWFITHIVKNQNSIIKKVSRKLFPRKLIVFLRSNFMPWLMSTNTVKEKVAMSESDKVKAEKYFKEDLEELKKNFGIQL